jgi:hypothetical protein
MGCSTVKEKLESQIMEIKLERVDIRNEREDRIKQYEKLTGEKIERKPIPDYYIPEEETSHTVRKNERKISKYSKISKSSRFKDESDEEEEDNNDDDDNDDDDDDYRRNKKKKKSQRRRQ